LITIIIIIIVVVTVTPLASLVVVHVRADRCDVFFWVDTFEIDAVNAIVAAVRRQLLTGSP
jgi:hypothetical protein